MPPTSYTLWHLIVAGAVGVIVGGLAAVFALWWYVRSLVDDE